MTATVRVLADRQMQEKRVVNSPKHRKAAIGSSGGKHSRGREKERETQEEEGGSVCGCGTFRITHMGLGDVIQAL